MLTERFIFERGKRRRVMHLAAYNRVGEFDGALCGINHNFNGSCNLPLGRRICKNCEREATQ